MDEDAPSQQTNSPNLEAEDYYLEGDTLVFTAAFLRKRGYCCGSGCRHCPYEDEEQSDQTA